MAVEACKWDEAGSGRPERRVRGTGPATHGVDINFVRCRRRRWRPLVRTGESLWCGLAASSLSSPSWLAALDQSSTRRRQLGGRPHEWPLAPAWRRVCRETRDCHGKHGPSMTYLASLAPCATSNVCYSVSHILNQSFDVWSSVGVTRCGYWCCRLRNNNPI